MMFPWRTVGLHASSSSSAATCAQRVDDHVDDMAKAENMVGRIPLIPCFLDGNATPTIPHKYSKSRSACFLAGCADAASEDGKRGSNVYEVNTWLWQFGRGKPRIGGLTIEETAERQDSARKSSDKRRKETREGRKRDGA